MLFRSSDDIGLYVTIILIMQALALFTSGGYLADQVLNSPSSLSSLDPSGALSDVLMSRLSTSDYAYASVVLFSVALLRSGYGRVASLRLHAFK
jgi:hypothetical protein